MDTNQMAGMQHSHDMAMGHGAFRLPLPVPLGTQYSEFNHHLAGVVVILVGLSVILLYYRPRTFSFMRYVWPASLIALGIYLVLYSDPDSWPTAMGASLADPEAVQHKVYALLLLLFGGIELSRSAGLLRRDAWKFVFPALVLVSVVYLVFHKHDSGPMEHMSMTSHTAVAYQHLIYIILGVEAVAARVLYDTKRIAGPWAAYIWPTLITFVGVALVLYRE